MARIIDADAILKKAKPMEELDGDGIPCEVMAVAAILIDDAPTVDAVEVVRCRDCKHSTPPSLVTQRYGKPGTLTCHNHNSPCNKRNVKCEGFCPYGERKDGDGNG